MLSARITAWVASLCVWLLPLIVGAQASDGGFSLDRFQPAPTTEDGLALALPRTLGHLRVGAALTLDYAHQPLVVSEPGKNHDSAIVAQRLVGHVQGALGLGERAELYVHVPITLVQTGDPEPGLGGVGFPTPQTAAFGDISLGGSLRLAGEDASKLQLGLMAQLSVPSGDPEALSGNGGVGVAGALTASVNLPRFSLAANLGALYRPRDDYGSAALGSELLFGLGGYLHFTARLLGLTELSGSTTFVDSQAFSSAGTPLQWLNGLRWTSPVQLVVTGAVGVGLTQAVGVPDVRGLLSLGFPGVRPATEPPDADHDGVPDRRDRCPESAEDRDGFQDADGCPDADNDHDGVLDRDDSCPLDPEDVDGFQDTDGCPEPDNDEDAVLDGQDSCPLNPEDVDGFEDDDGCPDPDNDHDGVLDAQDTCPNVAEDFDGFEDRDGCPDPDNDRDGVLDVDDECPRAPGPAASKGCPKAVRIDRSQIRILQRIEFETGRAELHPSAAPILVEVAQVLNANPQVRLLRVEGHTDDRGSEDYNRKLSQQRGETVMRFLVDEGIHGERLIAQGFGEDRPLVPNTTAEQRQTNRRVEFHILKPDPSDPAADTQDARRALDAAGAGPGPKSAPLESL